MSRSFWPCNDNAVGHSVYVCLSVCPHVAIVHCGDMISNIPVDCCDTETQVTRGIMSGIQNPTTTN